MERLKIILLILSIVAIRTSFAQNKDVIIQQRIEFISEQLETESIDLTDVLQALTYYYDHSLNLNNATEESLSELNLLTDVQINSLLLHREIYGKFISIYELQALSYWDLNTIKLILPFVKVDDRLDQLHVSFKEALKYGKMEAFLRYQRVIEPKEGYADVSDSVLNTSNSYYHGNADRYYTRFRYSYRTNLSLGVTAEKDPGEEFFNGNQRNGFDFYSAHAYYKGGKYLRAIALGDYQVQIGQGLNLWSGYAFGKSADVTNIKKTANSLKPYTSVDETRFMRGAAVELGVNKWAMTLFGSHKKVDGSVLSDSLLEIQEFATSINLSGLHRTNSEIARKNSLGESIFGTNLRYSSRALKVGVAGVYYGYSSPFIKDTLSYNQFDFRGKETIGLSADYNYVLKNFNFFGEISTSTHSGGLAMIQGVVVAIDRWASLSLLYRNYDKDYHTFYNAGLAEGSRTVNEQGLFGGLKLFFNQSFSINTYADVFRFPWLKFSVDAPSSGNEFLIQPSYRPNRRFEVYARFRQQVREKNSRLSDGTISPLESNTQRNYRINMNYQVSESIRLKSRIEYVTLDRESVGREEGVILTQDLVYKPKNLPIDVSLRYALFDTDSYDTRIYTHENNALYVFSIPAYYYRGSRAYVLLRYTFFRKFDLWARYSTSIFANRDSIGSGPEEVIGSTRSDITIQLRMKF